MKEYFKNIQEDDLSRQKPVEYILRLPPNELFNEKNRKGYLLDGVSLAVEIHERKADTVVFIDKGARPLAGFLRVLWKRLWPEDKLPVFKFISGRALATHLRHDEDRIHKKVVSLLRRGFEGWEHNFDGKNVMIVDELSASGQTLSNAAEFFKDAFPDIDGIFTVSTNNVLKSDFNKNNSESLSHLCRESDSLVNRPNIDTPQELEHLDTPFSKADRNVSQKKTVDYLLREIGKYEVLDEDVLKKIDENIVRLKNEGNSHTLPWERMKLALIDRLPKIREECEKLLG